VQRNINLMSNTLIDILQMTTNFPCIAVDEISTLFFRFDDITQIMIVCYLVYLERLTRDTFITEKQRLQFVVYG